MEFIYKVAAPVFALLVFLTNMITESIKKIKEGVNAKVVALLTAEILSVVACEAGAIYLQFAMWYFYVAAGVIGLLIGFVVAQVAETGYDGLYMELVELVRTLIKAILGSKEIEEDCFEDEEE